MGRRNAHPMEPRAAGVARPAGDPQPVARVSDKCRSRRSRGCRAMKNLFLITGMHRSGTSCVSNLLHRLGINHGADPELAEAKLDNKHGNWEDRALVSTNDLLLLYRHSFWFDPFNFTSPESRNDVPEYILQKIDVVKKHFSASDTRAGMKDPRLSLTLPFWRSVLSEYDLTLVYVFRRPEFVATSLAMRNSFPFEYGLALWEYYVRTAAFGAKGTNCVYVSFDRLLSEPQITCKKLADDIGLDLTLNAIDKAIETVVDPKACTSDPHGADVPEEVDQLFDALQSNGLSALDKSISDVGTHSWQRYAPTIHSRFLHKKILYLHDRIQQ